MTNNNLYDLPKVATIAVYDVESEQNLTVEEWNNLRQNNSSEITIIDKSGSNFRSEKEGYGPWRNTLCGCFCSKNLCDCGNPEGSIYKKDNWELGNVAASGEIGWGGSLHFGWCRDWFL